MAGIMLEATVDDKASPDIRKVEKALDKVGDQAEKSAKKSKNAFEKIGNAARKAGQAIRAVVGKLQMVAAAAAAAIAGGFGLVVRSGLQMNSTLENARVSFAGLTKDADRAVRIMQELTTFSASTPFQIEDLAAAAKALMAAGRSGKENLRIIGDAAAFAQVPIAELANTMGRLGSGANMGEAFNRLRELTVVTKDELEGEGLVFDRAGSYVGSAAEAFDAVVRIMDRKFGGMMEQMSLTWAGKISTMKDNFLLFAAELTRPLFYSLMPVIDEITETFNSWRTSGIATAIGSQIEQIMGPLAAKLAEMMKDLPRVYQWAVAIAMGFNAAWIAIKAGGEWIANVWTAAIDLVKFKVLGIGIAMQSAVKAGGLGTPTGISALVSGLSIAENMADTLRENLITAMSAPGGAEAFRQELEKIREYLATPLAVAPDLGPTQGPGLDDTEDPMADARARLAAAELEFQTAQGELWSNYWSGLGDMAKEGFIDFVSAEILESGFTIKNVLIDLWDSIERSFVKMTVSMVTNWVLAKAKMLFAEQSFQTAATAAKVAAVPGQVAADQATTASQVTKAKAGFFSAYAGMPFVGTALALAAIALMLKTVGAFATGGLVPGGGAGVDDSVLARVSGGEYIMPKGAVDRYGQGMLDDIRRGTYRPADYSLNLTLVGSAQEISESEVEDALVPVLERLNKQNRFRIKYATNV